MERVARVTAAIAAAHADAAQAETQLATTRVVNLTTEISEIKNSVAAKEKRDASKPGISSTDAETKIESSVFEELNHSTYDIVVQLTASAGRVRLARCEAVEAKSCAKAAEVSHVKVVEAAERAADDAKANAAARAAALAIALERARIADVEAEALRNIHDECKTALSEAIVDATDARETATEEKAKAAKAELERDDANAISKSIKESLASVAATLTATTSCLEETRGRVVRAEEKAAIKKC